MVDVGTWRARIGSWAGKVRVARRSLMASNGATVSTINTVLCAAVIAILLIIGGVELNPGPTTTTDEKLDAIMAKVEKLDSMEENVLMIKNQMSCVETKVNFLESKISDMEVTIESLSTANSDLIKQLNAMSRKEDYLENQSRRNNLVFRGLREKEGGNESWRDCEELILDVTRNVLGVAIQASDIERAHRVAGGKYPRAIVVKFLSFKKREEVFRNKKQLKGKTITINEDFSQRVLEDRRVLIPEMMSARADGWDAVVTFDKLKVNGRVYRVDENSRLIVPAYIDKTEQPKVNQQPKQQQQLQSQHQQQQQIRQPQSQNHQQQSQIRQPQSQHQLKQQQLLQQPEQQLLQRQLQHQPQQQRGFELIRQQQHQIRSDNAGLGSSKSEATEFQPRQSQRIRGEHPHADRMEPSPNGQQVATA